jgi:phenylacetate-coenzyme A ligase PaaK-like adenylate-forming protein
VIKHLAEEIFKIKNLQDFERKALEVFRFQAENNLVYRKFILHLGIKSSEVQTLSAIPFLPISFFKSHQILSSDAEPAIVFSSSGTTGTVNSLHPVIDIDLYRQSFQQTFHKFYGDIAEYNLLALLPSYAEREGSSLIYMIDDLMSKSRPDSNYFLYNHQELADKLCQLQKEKQKVILIGVTYALLDFIETYQFQFPELIVMETGGMKGKRKEIVREELHEILCRGFGVPKIHSEYGMTELMSQSYALKAGLYQSPPGCRVFAREINDPLGLPIFNRNGVLNVIDLYNLYSCSFIATSDLGKVHDNGSCEVLGRVDYSDTRGCNLLVL